MARDKNTHAKRQREIQKKQKAVDKKSRREQRKQHADHVEVLTRDDHPADGQ